MENLDIDITSEEKFLNLFGFELEKVGTASWAIKDAHDYVAGFVHKTRVERWNESPEDVIHTLVDYGNLKCNANRSLKDQNYVYRFFIEQEEGLADISLCLGSRPKLVVKYKNQLVSQFEMGSNFLRLSYDVSDKNHNINRVMYMQSDSPYYTEPFNGNMTYVLRLKKTAKIDAEEYYAEMGAKELGDNTLLFATSHRRPNDGSLVTRRELVDGTVADLIENHEDSIDAFQEYRKIINDTLPFQEDVIEKMFMGCELKHKAINALMFKGTQKR